MTRRPPRHSRRSVRSRSRAGSTTWTRVLLVLAVLVIPVLTLGPGRPIPGPPVTSLRLPTGTASSWSSIRYEVNGTLQGIEPSGAPGPYLEGAQVEVVARPCLGFDDCPFVASTVTSAPDGNFSLSLAPGEYFLVSNRTGAFGGTDAVLNLSNGAGGSYGPIALQAEPFVPYGNATFELPGWNNLSAYAANCNAALPCHTGTNPAPPYGAQQPMLSWTADGVFYVNASDELVFYSLATGALREIAPWQPLYDNLMEYEGIENTEYLTVDGSYVYEFGCPFVCNATAPVDFYAVNTTTGRIFSTTLALTEASDFAKNGQVDLIGENGNLTIAAFAEADGSVVGYNLWNGTQWVLGTLPFFEANNLYWVPMWGSYLDVRAQGASPETVDQVRLSGEYPGTRLETVASLPDPERFPINGVNGVVYNLSAQTMEFTSQNITGSAITYRASLGAGGILDALAPIWGTPRSTLGIWPSTGAYPNLAASEHRPTMLLTGPAFAGFGDGWFENRSAFVDPGSGVWTSTNVTLDRSAGRNLSFRQTGPGPAALEGLFYNTTYALLPASYDCRTNHSRCPIEGDVTPSTPVGTVWWSWRSGHPEFPFPTDAPLAEVAPPIAPTGVRITPSLGTLLVDWNASATPASELLGYRVTFGPSTGGPYRTEWFGGASTGGTIGPVTTGAEYVVEVAAWNLHGPSSPTIGTAPFDDPTGWLNLTVGPEVANVTLGATAVVLDDGAADLPLQVGNYTLNITAPGYRSFTDPIGISPDRTVSLTVALTGIPPILEGTVDPSSAHLFVDASPVPVAANGSFRETLIPGEYALWAGAPGYFPLGPWNLTVGYGQVVQEHVRLNRSYGWLMGTVSPSNVSATLNGAAVNITAGQLILRLPTQSYWLNFTEPGLQPLDLGPLNVTPLNTTNFRAVLVPYTGTFELSVDPANASVRLDNRSLLLAGGHAVATVPAGAHELDLNAPGYDPLRLVRALLPNATIVLTLSLNRSLGWVAGRVHPSTGILAVDGQLVTLDPDGSYNVTAPVGTNELALGAPGYRPATQNVTVPDHATVWVNLTLERVGSATISPPGLSPVPAVAGLVAVAGITILAGAAFFLVRRRPPTG